MLIAKVGNERNLQTKISQVLQTVMSSKFQCFCMEPGQPCHFMSSFVPTLVGLSGESGPPASKWLYNSHYEHFPLRQAFRFGFVLNVSFSCDGLTLIISLNIDT